MKMRKSFYLLLSIILLASVAVPAQQTTALITDGFTKKELHIKKPISKNYNGKTGCYLAIEYDFEDSISVYIGNKLISVNRLKYTLPEEKTSIYPDNRVIIKLDYHRTIDQNGECTILFHKEKVYLKFRLYKSIPYYSFGIKKDSPAWVLDLLKVFPWP